MPSQARAAKSEKLSSARIELLRAESIESLRGLQETVVRMRRQLRSMETVGLRQALRLLEAGRPAHQIATTVDVAGHRNAVSALMREIQAARHRAQRAQFKLAAAEGTSMADIARAWGVSRQLVSRMVKEPIPRRRKT
jgi:hypothetical protein